MLLSYYGDDFTGSTDVMEALSQAGVRTILLLDASYAKDLSRIKNFDAVGIAGVSRTMSPTAMKAVLPSIYDTLRRLGASIVHYKTCSTFDSSPEIGSIGCAIDLGQQVFHSPFVPLVVGAPVLGRYCVFGNLFARSGLESEPYRLDRHPTMSQHPVTPMQESELRLHLQKQTEKSIALFDVLKLAAPPDERRKSFAEVVAERPDIVLFDILYNEHLEVIGELIWDNVPASGQLFTAGSSGLEYAMTKHWQTVGVIDKPAALPKAKQVEQLLVVSGSCSPVTAKQIEVAVNDGFMELALRPDALLDPNTSEAELEEYTNRGLDAVKSGKSVILHTCTGPQDPRIEATRLKSRSLQSSEQSAETAGATLGRHLGQLLKNLLSHASPPRVVVAGGDSSGYVATELGLQALEMITPLQAGGPLCTAHAPGTNYDQLEVIFKGGQVGKASFFVHALKGDQA